MVNVKKTDCCLFFFLIDERVTDVTRTGSTPDDQVAQE